MLKSFFLNESGFVAPWTALSWSWVAGIIVGAFSLLTPVITAYAAFENCDTDICWWGQKVECCCDEDYNPTIECGWFRYTCECS